MNQGMSVGDFFVRLGMDPRELKKGLDDAEARLLQFAAKYKNIGAEVASTADKILRSGVISADELTKRVNTLVNAGMTMRGAMAAIGQEYDNQISQLDRLGNAHDKTVKTIGQLGQTIKRVGEDMTYVGIRMTTAVTAPIVGATVAIMKYASQMDVAEKSSARMLGSARIAGELMDQIREVATHSTMDFPSLVEGVRRMTAMQAPVGTLIRDLKIMGDTVAAMAGGDSGVMNRFIKVLGDVRSKGYLAAEEIRQFSNIPIATVKILSEELGITTTEVLKRVKAKTLDATTTIEALMKGLSKRYGGEMENLANNTLPGLWSQIVKQTQFAAADIGRSMMPMAKDVAKSLLDVIDRVRELARAFTDLPPWLQKTSIGLLAIAAGAGPALMIMGQLTASIGHIVHGIASLGAYLGGAGEGATVGASLGAGAMVLAKGIAVIAAIVGTVRFAKWAYDLTAAKLELDGVGAATKRVGDEAEKASQKMGTMASAWEIFKVMLRDPAGSGMIGAPVPYSWTAKDWAKAKKPNAIPSNLAPMTTASGTTNLFMEGINAGNRKAVQDAEDNSRAIASAWNTLRLTDWKGIADEMIKSFGMISSSLSPRLAVQAVTEIINALDKARDAGQITQTQFEQQMGKWEKLLDKLPSFRKNNETNYFTPPPFTGDLLGPKSDHDLESYLKAFPDQLPAISEQLKERGRQAAANWAVLFKEFAEAAPVADRYNDKISGTGKILADNGKLLKEFIDIQLNDPNADPLSAAFKRQGVTSQAEFKALAKQAIADYETVRKSAGSTTKDVQRMWVNSIEAQLRAGVKFTEGTMAQYRKLKNETGDEVKFMTRHWTSFKNQVSTIFTDLSRSIADIFIPKLGSGNSTVVSGLPDRIFNAFQSANQDLAAKGYSNPTQALQQIVDQIKQAGSAADANAIALRNFGSMGPEIAAMIRRGTISTAQLTDAIKKSGDSMEKFSKDSEKFTHKIAELFRELERAIARALLEEAAKAIGEFVAKHLKKLADSLLDIIGLGKKVGTSIATGVATGAAEGGGELIGGILTDDMPDIINGIPQVIGGGASAAGGAAGAASKAAGMGISGAINMVTGAVSAISGVIGNFQQARSNNLLYRLGDHTLRIFNEVYNIRRDSYILWNQLYLKLDDIWNEIRNVVRTSGGGISGSGMMDVLVNTRDIQREWLGNIFNRMAEMPNWIAAALVNTSANSMAVADVVGGSSNINIYIDGASVGSGAIPQDALDLFRAGAKALRMKGVRGRTGR